MSMCVVLVKLGDENIERILDDPPLVWRVIAPKSPWIYDEARKNASGPRGLTARFGNKGTKPSHELKMSKIEGEEIDLDKSWHGIHYFLNRSTWEGRFPLGFLVSWGRPVGDIDVGYGPARVFRAEEAKAIHQAVAAVTDDDLRARFDPADMREKDIYPDIWDRDPTEDDTLEYLIEYLQLLRGFLRQTVEAGLGVVVYQA